VHQLDFSDERIQQNVWLAGKCAIGGHAAFHESDFSEFDDRRRAGD
jgi:hypothetical protein